MYVFVPADKASNNVIIVLRLHYVGVLNKELVNTKSYTSATCTLSEHALHVWIPIPLQRITMPFSMVM